MGSPGAGAWPRASTTPSGSTASARFDGWVLYASQSPAAHAARGLVFGGMYRRSDGLRIASVAQEGLVRIPRS